MNPSKIAQIFFVAVVGIIGAYFVIFNSSATVSQQNQELNSPKDGKLLVENPLQLVADGYNPNIIDNIGLNNVKKLSDNLGKKNIDFNSTNLTQLTAQSLFGGIKTLDTNGSNPFINSNPNDAKTQKIIQQSIDNISSMSLNFPSHLNEIKISSDNSKNAKTAYLDDFKNIFYQNTADKSLIINSVYDLGKDFQDDCTVQSGASLNGKRAALFGKLLSQYLKLPVSSDWLDFHKKVIDFYTKGQIILQSMANCSEDPIKGYSMSQQVATVFVMDSANIYKMEKEKYAEVGLDYNSMIKSMQ